MLNFQLKKNPSPAGRGQGEGVIYQQLTPIHLQQSPIKINYSLFIIHYSLFIIHYSLFIIHRVRAYISTTLKRIFKTIFIP